MITPACECGALQHEGSHEDALKKESGVWIIYEPVHKRHRSTLFRMLMLLWNQSLAIPADMR